MKKETDGRNLISKKGLAELLGVSADKAMEIARERHWRAFFISNKVVMFNLAELARDFDDEAVVLAK